MGVLLALFILAVITGFIAARMAYINLNYGSDFKRYETWKAVAVIAYMAAVILFLVLFFNAVFWHYDTIWGYPK